MIILNCEFFPRTQIPVTPSQGEFCKLDITSWNLDESSKHIEQFFES